MLKNYFATAFRYLLRNRNTSLINIMGLALGIGCVLIILAVVRYERSYDQFHSDADRIYRVVRTGEVDGETEYRTGIPHAAPEALRSDLTVAGEVTAMHYVGGLQLSVVETEPEGTKRQFQEDEGITFIDSDFFKLFDYAGTGFQWISGNPETALKEPFSVVLTQTMANKYFPRGDALGKSLSLDNLMDVKVTGVVADLPPNSDFPFRAMLSYSTLNTEGLLKDNFSDWYSVSDEHQGYVLLNEGVTPEEAEAQILKIHAANVSESMAEFRQYKLQPLKEVHTDARFGNYQSRTVSKETVWALLIIGLFIISTASINFVNLSTAQSVLRSKEVGIRKTMGSGRLLLIWQFLGETFIITLLAGMLALGGAELAMVYARDLLQIDQGVALLTDPATLVSLVAIILVVTILAGSYPALTISGFNPVAALKNKISNGSPQKMKLRQGLVTLQFVIAQIFIIGTIVVVRQMDYFRSAELGFEQEAIITVKFPARNTPPLSTLETLENQWKTTPAVASVSFASSSPAGVGRNTSHWDIRRKGAPEGEESITFERQAIDEQYLDLFEIPLVAGRNFQPNDTAKHIIINRKLSERVGLSEPDQAIGEIMLIGNDAYEIVGVTENFHTKSLREEIDYVGFLIDPQQYYTANIKLNLAGDASGKTNQWSGTLQQLAATWAAMYPEYMFNYQFLDQSVAAYYQEEARLTKLFKVLAGITIFIGCLGLYGLVAFMAVRRTKEVGIRKVLGASVQHILILFSKEFIHLILIAFCIAGPIAFYLMQQWLQNFTYQVNLGAGVFILAIAASAIIATLTVSYQSLRAALANPVDSLRNE
jgi:putative ABC transport system permease protein